MPASDTTLASLAAMRGAADTLAHEATVAACVAIHGAEAAQQRTLARALAQADIVTAAAAAIRAEARETVRERFVRSVEAESDPRVSHGGAA